MILVESCATLLGVLCVWLTIRQNILCWPAGLIQVVLFIFVFYRVRLYSDAVLHVLYVFMQLYGWYHWRTGVSRSFGLPVTTLSAATRAMWGCLAILGTWFWGYGMSTFTNASAAYVDAFVAITSLLAQWLLTRKKLESWIFWIAVDVVAVCLYLYKGLFITSMLYALFLGMAAAGFLAWRRSMTKPMVEFRADAA